MRAMVMHAPRQPLRLEERPDPVAGPGEIVVRVEACAVCRTDLHVVDGDLTEPKLPLVPGHEIVGIVESCGEGRRSCPRPARRHSLARPYLRLLQLLRQRAGEPLRQSWVHRLHLRRRVCQPCGGGCGFRLSARRLLRSGRHRTLDVRRADRLAVAEDGGRGQADRHLRLRCGRPHHRAGLHPSGPRGLCLYPGRR